MDTSRTIQKDLAASLKLSQATISLALANHPRISEATRSKVLAAAQKLGYTPDPYLSSLAEYRKKIRKVGYRSTIAWVHNFLGPTGFHDKNSQTMLFESAQVQAEKRGYKLENFWLREPGMSMRRVNQILENRGISGLLIMPQLKTHSHLRLDWDRFSVVRLGDYTLTKPEFHTVTADHYRSVSIGLREMRKMGYRKIGYVSL
ncbi:MAG: LacI family DNA-binding transcriptional regulator, partial [Verrucomicrobiota bacterium]